MTRYVLYADEADQDGSKEFLVYVGCIFPSDQLKKICARLAAECHGTPFNALNLKFSPGKLAADQNIRSTHTDIKQKALQLGVESGVEIVCYLAPFTIAKGISHEERLKFGVNTILMKFNQYLGSV